MGRPVSDPSQRPHGGRLGPGWGTEHWQRKARSHTATVRAGHVGRVLPPGRPDMGSDCYPVGRPIDGPVPPCATVLLGALRVRHSRTDQHPPDRPARRPYQPRAPRGRDAKCRSSANPPSAHPGGIGEWRTRALSSTSRRGEWEPPPPSAWRLPNTPSGPCQILALPCDSAAVRFRAA